MPRLPLHVWLGPLTVAVLASAAPAFAAIPTHVRVLDHPAKIQVSSSAPAGIVMEAQPGTTLDVLRKDGGWYWVILPRDGYGTRRGGWVRADGCGCGGTVGGTTGSARRRTTRDEG
jgi:hypothetical protein